MINTLSITQRTKEFRRHASISPKYIPVVAIPFSIYLISDVICLIIDCWLVIVLLLFFLFFIFVLTLVLCARSILISSCFIFIIAIFIYIIFFFLLSFLFLFFICFVLGNIWSCSLFYYLIVPVDYFPSEFVNSNSFK